MFSMNQKVVYPGYGVAQISRIFEKKFGTQSSMFCELKFFNQDMTVMVPMEKAIDIGIRPLSSAAYINRVLSSIPVKKNEMQELILSINWNKRSKGYQNRLKTGSLEDTFGIYSDLMLLSLTKTLSFGEKNLLQKTEILLVEEISAAENIEVGKAIEYLRSFFNKSHGSSYSSSHQMI